MWKVVVKKKVSDRLHKLPKRIAEIADALMADLEKKGPSPGKKWKNYTPLEGMKHHCHLTYRYVACWEVVGNEIKLIEVYYVGSRESAPY